MKKILIISMMLLALTGCGNLSPKIDPKLEENIDNQNGKIDEIENLQNSLKLEILKLQQKAEITDSQLDKVQNGFINIQGIEIFSGSVGAVAVSLLFVTFVFIIYYRQKYLVNKQINDIITTTVKTFGDDNIKEEIYKACLFTKVEKEIYKKLN